MDWPAPMLATATEQLPADDEKWSYEFKWDGVRALVRISGDRVEARSRNALDITVGYPELTSLVGKLPAGLILDGEIVAFEKAGRPSFERLQRRMHVSSAGRSSQLASEVPVRFLAFDLLAVDDRPIFDQPWSQRRQALESLNLDLPAVAVPPSWPGDGAAVFAASRQNQLEGVVCKRLDSVYEPGRRSRNWLKIKNIRTQEVLVGGWRPGAGRRAGTIGSLLLGVPDEAGLRYAGHVGTGFSDRALDDLATQLKPMRRDSSPFVDVLPTAHRRDAVWVEPAVVGEVGFSEWTREGRLRHPTWRGLRPDKTPSEVRRES